MEASTMKSRSSFAIQRLMNAMRQDHADGGFIVFDTLTLDDDRLGSFYDYPNALRDYFRDIGRMVLAAEGRKANDSHADCYQYFCVPEYGTANGRLHFFFFSSRRRHTRYIGDWSSDVCSSDLALVGRLGGGQLRRPKEMDGLGREAGGGPDGREPLEPPRPDAGLFLQLAPRAGLRDRKSVV